MSVLINKNTVLALAKDVTLEGGAKHRCIDATQISELPSVEVVCCVECKHWVEEIPLPPSTAIKMYCNVWGISTCRDDFCSRCDRDYGIID